IIQTNWQIGRPIRLLTVTAQNLLPASDATGQLSFFDSSEDMKTQKNEKLERTMDAIRGKYGRHSIQHGNVLQNDMGISDHEEAEKDEEEEETEGT
ncbi:MAG: hypothetical protein FWF49_05355, partial [Oscillospiraceae bacterium]|nr:hypothetical protein [Oscillospiraceae bacterium]